MNRIEQILEKAERDGAVHRFRGSDPIGLAAVAPVDPVGNDGIADEEVSAANGTHRLGATPVTAIPMPVPMRSVSGARLDRLLVAAVSPGEAAADQYRALRTRLLHSEVGSTLNLVLVTSPVRGDGKTLTAANLALTMAQDQHRRVCLADADMRSPQVHRLFGVPEGPGLSDVLAGHAPLNDALVGFEEHQITLLPAGHLPANPSGLLGDTAMRRLLDALRSQFDTVIIDGPSATPLADVGILTPLVDGVLLVVRSGMTPKPAIHDALGALDASKMLGVVLNEAG